MPAVAVEHLTKSYQGTEAVRDVAFEVNEGEVFALLGPNGAGKTSIIEILEGFRKRDHGHVVVLGLDPADAAMSRQLRERMGVVLQELAVEPFLSVRQALHAQCRLLPESAISRRGARARWALREGGRQGEVALRWSAAPLGPRAWHRREPESAVP